MNAVCGSAADASDHEQDPIKLSSLPPGRVELDGGVAVQITCGLQHTGLHCTTHRALNQLMHL